MSEAKIDFSFNNLHFSCEGDKDWVGIQLNSVLNRIPGLNKPEPSVQPEVVKTLVEKTEAIAEVAVATEAEVVTEAEVSEEVADVLVENAPVAEVRRRRGRRPRLVTEDEVISETEAPIEEVKEKLKRGRKPKVVAEPIVEEIATDPLIDFLREKNSEKNQVKKFLATAVYLHSQGEEKFSTPSISKVLKASNSEKLINASDCLNKNEKKGFCIKEGKEFILTEAGIRSILGGSEE